MEHLEKKITSKQTLREIYRDKNICIAEKIRIDADQNILDRWISIRRVDKQGQIVKGKKGIVSIANYTEPITMYGKTHSNKLLNFFVWDNVYKNYCNKVMEVEPNIFTIGEPERISNGNILLKSLNHPYQVEGQEIKYVNQLPYEAGLTARCFVTLGSKKTFEIVENAFYETHGTDSKLIRFPITQKGLDDLQKSYDKSKSKITRYKGNAAKEVIERQNKLKDGEGKSN